MQIPAQSAHFIRHSWRPRRPERECLSLPFGWNDRGHCVVCCATQQGDVPVKSYIGAIDQGTTSTRFMVFDKSARVVAVAQKEHEQIFPRPGWVEHDALEILRRTEEVIAEGLGQRGLRASDLAAIGITNQRETTVLWERKTGEPVSHAIVWQDTRVAEDVARFVESGGQDRFRQQTGLPLSTYFSSLKLRWLLQNVPGAREKAAAGELLFGNIDTLLLWNLTGGIRGGVHVTDVTNASRRCAQAVKSTEKPRSAPLRAFLSAESSAISKRRWLGRRASGPARSRTLMELAAFC
jgi:glycerol kinase